MSNILLLANIEKIDDITYFELNQFTGGGEYRVSTYKLFSPCIFLTVIVLYWFEVYTYPSQDGRMSSGDRGMLATIMDTIHCTDILNALNIITSTSGDQAIVS